MNEITYGMNDTKSVWLVDWFPKYFDTITIFDKLDDIFQN